MGFKMRVRMFVQVWLMEDRWFVRKVVMVGWYIGRRVDAQADVAGRDRH
jgi:hypothetical protein